MGIMSGRDLRQPPLAVLIVMCWLIVVAQLLYVDWSMVTRTLGDTDDAMRLVAVHNFLAGQGWFDLHEARLAPPLGYDSHWSRLIDAGLAGLFLAFNLVVDAARAELMMRIVWPLLWLLPLIIATVAIAWRIGGREAAVMALLLVVVGMPAFRQFLPGRIDHHNVQVALAMAALATAAWGDRVGSAAACGALTGAALAIGLECLPLLVMAAAAPALRYCVDRDGAPALRAYGLALAVSTLAAFLVSVGPHQWGRTTCDALAINWMEPVVFAGLLLVMVGGLLPGRGTPSRCAAVAAVVAVAAATFVALEPRCLAGPYAMMDTTLQTAWLSDIREMQPLLSILRTEPSVAAAIMAFPVMTMIAIVLLARAPEMRRNDGFLLAAATSLVAIALTVVAVKTFHYAVWIGMPVVAAFVPHLLATLRLHSMGARVFIAIMLTPAVLSSAAGAAVQVAAGGPITNRERVKLGCFDSKSYAQLTRLPTGVIASDIDFGPFILALTPHAALGAPYHRLSEGIIASHQVFALPADAARRVIDAHGVDYLLACGAVPPSDLTAAERNSGLAAQLIAGTPPVWLEKLPAADGDVFTVYRIRRPGAVRP